MTASDTVRVSKLGFKSASSYTKKSMICNSKGGNILFKTGDTGNLFLHYFSFPLPDHIHGIMIYRFSKDNYNQFHYHAKFKKKMVLIPTVDIISEIFFNPLFAVLKHQCSKISIQTNAVNEVKICLHFFILRIQLSF